MGECDVDLISRSPRICRLGSSILFIAFSICFLSCVTTSEYKFNRPKESVDRAVINVLDNLQLSRRHVRYFSSVEYPDYTELNIESNFMLREYLRSAILQELYFLDGYTVPPNPPYFAEKKLSTLILLSLVNAGFASNYSTRDYAGYGLIPESGRLVSILSGGMELLIIATQLLSMPFGEASQEDALTSAIVGAVIVLQFKTSVVVQGAVYNRRHRIGLASGYNFDPEFDVTEFFEIPIEWKPGVLSGMDTITTQRLFDRRDVEGKTLAIVAVDAPTPEESLALQEFLAAALLERGFGSVVRRQTIARIIAESRSSEIESDETAIAIGGNAGADYVIVGSRTDLDGYYYLSLRLLSTESGEVVSSSLVSVGSRDDFVNLSKNAIEELFDSTE